MQFFARRAATGLFRTATVGATFTSFAFAQGAEGAPAQVCPVNHGKPVEAPPAVCPVNHGKPVEVPPAQVCPVNHGKPIEAPPAVCPVNHGKPVEAPPAVCPVNHGKPVEASPAVCPVNHSKPVETAPAPAVCPVNHGNPAASSAPLERPRVCPAKYQTQSGERYVNPNAADGAYHNSTIHTDYDVSKIEDANKRWGFVIPSTGRGNSDDGAHWVNPTPLELFRACHARDEDGVFDEESAKIVADVHSAVVSDSWAAVLEWEDKYNDSCQQGPMLIEFGGKQDRLSPKAWLFTNFLDAHVFDRHDWIIDRCGTKVRYVIDYYDSDGLPKEEGEEGNPAEFGFVDARPALDTPRAVWDRLEMAAKQKMRGEKWW